MNKQKNIASNSENNNGNCINANNLENNKIASNSENNNGNCNDTTSQVNYINLTLPLTKSALASLRVNDKVMLNGDLLVFRDAGHKRLFESIARGNQDFSFVGQTIYFMGPSPAKDGEIIGSAGPTTSERMEKYTPYMFEHGLSAQVGKGKRSQETINACKLYGTVYLVAIGGAGALYQHCITAAAVVHYPELGAEAVRLITVKDFPVVVGVDTLGNNIFKR